MKGFKHTASSDILNIDSDARGSLLFKDLDAHPENDDDLELQLAKDAAHIDNVGPSKFTSNFKKTEDNESGRMEKDICNTWHVGCRKDMWFMMLLMVCSLAVWFQGNDILTKREQDTFMPPRKAQRREKSVREL